MEKVKPNISRRSFLGLAGIAGATAGMTALAGCSSSEGAGDAAPVEQAPDNVSAIKPLPEPSAWDNEVDVVVAGTGSGLVAALRCAELGAKVVAFDPAASWGGSSKETDIFAVVGSKYQTQLWEAMDLTEMGMPGMTLADMFDASMGGHDEATMKAMFRATYLPQPGGSISTASGSSSSSATGGQAFIAQGHVETVDALLDCTADVTDWMVEKIAPYGVTLGPVTAYSTSGLLFLCPVGAEAGDFVARTNYTAFEALYKACEEAGVQFSFSNGVTGLVADETGRVIGVQAADGSFTKASKGVILATGGMASNRDMLARYCPSLYNGCFNSTATMNDDGSGIRMGLGAGGIMDGFDSANCFDGGIQTDNFNHYLYKGDVQFARNVPSVFNIRGERVPWYSLYSIGFTDQSGILMGQPGGYGIAVADANYEAIMNESTEPICRKPITPEMCEAAGANVERLPEAVCERDWRIGFQQGLDGGWIVSADTIEELASKLEVNAENLKRGVEQWNATCAAGADEMFGLDPALLRPIEKAPFYAVKVNGTILNTWCGLACDWRTGAVLDASANPIPGLYAGGATMGGSSGIGSLGSTRNPGGGVSFAMGTCFNAANAVMGA
ncbi:MAG: FAD-binding protein [Eggerthellaceae bacterium]|nr:FAD-binding protein [Eggerthellaceae bacterium]